MRARVVHGFECPECGDFTEGKSLGRGTSAWLCPVAEEITEEEPTKVSGSPCPHCYEFVIGFVPPGEQPETRVVCEHCKDDEAPSEEEHEKVRVWTLEACDCQVMEKPEKTKRYRCGECEELHEEREDARDCCRDY